MLPTKGLQKVEYFRKKNKCSVCKINQKVLVRYGRKGKKAPKKRYVFIRKIGKVGKYDKYKDLLDNQKVPTWFSVEDVADLQVLRGSNKKNAAKKFHERLREMVKQPQDQCDEQG